MRTWLRICLAMNGGPQVIYSKTTPIDQRLVTGQEYYIIDEGRRAILKKIEEVGDLHVLHFDLDKPNDYETLLANGWSEQRPDPVPIVA